MSQVSMRENLVQSLSESEGVSLEGPVKWTQGDWWKGLKVHLQSENSSYERTVYWGLRDTGFLANASFVVDVPHCMFFPVCLHYADSGSVWASLLIVCPQLPSLPNT